jgi:flavin reductase (DIM6/NTAB) family NADH-FMN oxidoreductase RutF
MITNEEFRAALGRFASGVTVITTRDAAGKPHGLTVSAFCSLSAEPPLILACIHKQTTSHSAFFEREAFVVNILGEDQQHVSRQFAEPAIDKFNGTVFSENEDGLPKLEDCLVTLDCRVVEAHDGGDHTIIIGAIERAEIGQGRPLIYFYGNYRKIEKSPASKILH